MSEIVNLKRQRKRLARQEKNATAEENRRHFGRSNPERKKQEMEEARAESQLDGHRREG